MKIFDCFTFNDENHILEIRLNELNEHVDFFIIIEFGQNHQGKLSNALEYVKIFSALGADAIKFQVRNNKSLFSNEAYKANYNSENAFAKTYGKHREKLELSYNDLVKVRKECRKYKCLQPVYKTVEDKII